MINGAGTPRVSVIIPTYNRAGYLCQALDSVFDQSFEPWEVIVVDDGSSDATPDVVRSFGQRVRYECQDHQGVAAARNLGLALASGDLIAWLDSDDRWKPRFLSTVVPVLEEQLEVDGVYTGFLHIDAEGTEHKRSTRCVPPEELFDRLVEGNFIVTPALVVRSRCFRKVGHFDTQLRVAEDYDMWLRLARSFTIVGLPQVLVEVRVHGDNTMSDLEAFGEAHIAIAQKHFGGAYNARDAQPPENKRGHALAYRSIALAHAQQGSFDAAWSYLAKAVAISPALLARLDTFYELACGDQDRALRGQADLLDVEGNAVQLLQRLDYLFTNAPANVRALRPAAYGNAYLALAMLSDQAADWVAARRYLVRAIWANRSLLMSRPVGRRFLKLCAGRRVIQRLRRLRRDKSHQCAFKGE